MCKINTYEIVVVHLSVFIIISLYIYLQCKLLSVVLLLSLLLHLFTFYNDNNIIDIIILCYTRVDVTLTHLCDETDVLGV